jgi:O-antigen/teichoic acid export membrane protein
VFALYLLGLSIDGALIVNTLGSIIALAYIASRIPIKSMHCHITMVFPLLRLALPLAITVLIASLLYQLDLWILKVLLPEDTPKAIGIYIAASQVARIPHLGALTVTLVMFSSISHALGHHNISLAQRYVRGAVRFLWVVLLPVSVLIAVEAEEIMTLLYSAQYISGGHVLRIQIFGFSLFAFLDTFLIILQARGEIYTSMGIGFGLILLMVVLSLVLVPIFGPLGAALTLTVTMGVGVAITGVFVYRRFGAVLTLPVLIKVGVATAIAVVAGAHISISGPLLLLQYIGLIVLYTLTLALLGKLTWEDLRPFALWQHQSS